MDQNSSNGSGRSNWREKLGIGSNAKELAKNSNEINVSRPVVKPLPQAEPRISIRPAAPPAGTAPRAPQAVTKTAPMAPRAAARPASSSSQAASGARPTRPAAEGENPLADKLRAQREAAERAAEQRIQLAREKALEGETASPPPSVRSGSQRLTASADKPKFTFAEEELEHARDEEDVTEGEAEATPATPPVSTPVVASQPPPPAPVQREYTPVFQQPKNGVRSAPLAPARQPLGGQPPLSDPRYRQPSTGYQPQYSPTQQPQGYRPLDPPGMKRQGAAVPPVRNYGPPPLRYPDRQGTDPRLVAQREAYEAYRRGLPQPGVPAIDEEEIFEEAPRAVRPPPARLRRPAVEEEDVGEVFEDEVPPMPTRRRPSAQEYNQAYREFEEDYSGDTRRRSSGPWLLLGLLLLAAIVTAGGVWFYQKSKMASPVTPAVQGETSTDQVPVIPAPQQPAKVTTEQPAANQQTEQVVTPAPEQKKKQIYDRIVGDQEVPNNTMVPTVEQPVQPEAAPATDGQGATTAPQPDEPAPPAATQPSTQDTQGNSAEPLPLPLPPPPGGDSNDGTQGALPTPAAPQAVANAIPEPPQLPSAASSSTNAAAVPSSTIDESNAPVPGENLTPAAAATAEEPPVVAAPAPSAPAAKQADTDTATPPQTAKKKIASNKKAVTKKAKDAETEANAVTGAKPVVLVPPAATDNSTASTVTASNEAAPAPAPAEQTGQESGSGSFFSKLLNGSENSAFKRRKGKSQDGISATSSSDGSDSTGATTQVASAEPQSQAVPDPQPIQMPPPEPAKSSDSGASGNSGGAYVAQLTSFRSEAEAVAEFNRLKARHPSVLSGMSSRISAGSAAGMTRYSLGVGPLANKAAAEDVCNKLFSEGERDCLAKRL